MIFNFLFPIAYCRFGKEQMRIKQLFFDRDKIISAVDTATRKVLSRFGAFVRTAAKSSIRRRKAASAPGSPPSSHTGLLKKFIFFGYDPDRKSVVIGPERLNAKNTDAPHTLEYGGMTTIENRTAKRQVRIVPRPYMGPAFEKEKPKLSAMWRDSVK